MTASKQIQELRKISEILGTSLVFRYYDTECPNNRFHCFLDRVEIKDGVALISSYGSGSTKNKAAKDYMNELRGRILVHNAFSKDRKELIVV